MPEKPTVAVDLGTLDGSTPAHLRITSADGSTQIIDLETLLLRLIEKPTPAGNRGERPATRAATRAVFRYLWDYNFDDRLTARELARLATGYAVHLGLEGADLLDPENSTFREIAGDMLAAGRAPGKPGWDPD
jgi:hypothetical protein